MTALVAVTSEVSAKLCKPYCRGERRCPFTRPGGMGPVCVKGTSMGEKIKVLGNCTGAPNFQPIPFEQQRVVARKRSSIVQGVGTPVPA